MNNKLDDQASAIANSSGFPLQMRVANVISSSSNWRVLFEEHPWRSHETSAEGFIDIVAANRVHPSREPRPETMIIECKRVRHTAWVFLIPATTQTPRTHARVWESHRAGSNWTKFGWADRQADGSFESRYCAIAGQEQGRRNMLERTASELLTSIESFAQQEKEVQDQRGTADFDRVYVPVIVTTADVVVSHFEPTNISLNDGSLPRDATFSSEPYVRFRKSFTTGAQASSGSSVRDHHSVSERTIFVVNAENIAAFLNKFELDK